MALSSRSGSRYTGSVFHLFRQSITAVEADRRLPPTVSDMASRDAFVRGKSLDYHHIFAV